MPAEASLAATDAPITPAPITTQRRDPTEAMTPTVGGRHQAGKPRDRSYSPATIRPRDLRTLTPGSSAPC